MNAHAAGANAWRVAALTMMRPEQLEQLLGADAQRAFLWVRAAAEHGLVEAQVRLGRMLLSGEGTARNEAAAFGWFARAAETGDADAQNMLGRCYENGWGVAANAAWAVEWFSRAAAQGHAWAQYNLGHMQLDGNGVPRDPVAAFASYMLAAEQGHARAMNLVARCYEEGWGVSHDAVAARSWYRRSAEGGYFRGAYNYATVLSSESRVVCAAYWLQKALTSAPGAARQNMLKTIRENTGLAPLLTCVEAAGATEGLV